MRVQNEGTGKSSWWMLNPDAKPGKSVRRRAASMETSKFEKRRGRVKKRVEQMRNGVLTSKTAYPFQAMSSSDFSMSQSYFLTSFSSADVTGVLNDVNSSPGSSVSEGLDLFPESPLHRYLSNQRCLVTQSSKFFWKNLDFIIFVTRFFQFLNIFKRFRFDCVYSSYSN